MSHLDLLQTKQARLLGNMNPLIFPAMLLDRLLMSLRELVILQYMPMEYLHQVVFFEIIVDSHLRMIVVDRLCFHHCL